MEPQNAVPLCTRDVDDYSHSMRGYEHHMGPSGDSSHVHHCSCNIPEQQLYNKPETPKQYFEQPCQQGMQDYQQPSQQGIQRYEVAAPQTAQRYEPHPQQGLPRDEVVSPQTTHRYEQTSQQGMQNCANSPSYATPLPERTAVQKTPPPNPCCTTPCCAGSSEVCRPVNLQYEAGQQRRSANYTVSDPKPENAASYQAQVPRPEDNLEPGHTPQHPYETSGAAQVNPVPFPTYVSPTHQDVRGGTSQTQSKEQEAPEAYWQSCQSQVYRSNTEKRLPPFHTEQRTHQSSSVPLGSARSTRLHLNHLSFKDKQLVMSALRKTSLNLNCLDLLQERDKNQCGRVCRRDFQIVMDRAGLLKELSSREVEALFKGFPGGSETELDYSKFSTACRDVGSRPNV